MKAVREVVAIVCVILAPSVGTSRAEAQSRVELIPSAGIFLPTTALGRIQFASQIADVPATFRTARLRPGVAVALAGALRGPGSPQSYWLELGYVPAVEMTFDDAPSVFSATVRSIALGVGRDLSAGVVRVHARLGGGLRSYGITPHVSDGPLLPSSALDPEGVAALGVSWALSGLALELEASDHVGTVRLDRQNAQAERHGQNRVHVRIGLRI